MYETERSDGVASEKAVLVRVILPGQIVGDDPLDEISGLAETAGARIVSGLTQRRESPDVTTYLGKGKVEELKALVEHRDADVVIFDNDLAPSQTRNLEKALDVKTLDRTELILDIFASNAKTSEARLAVELAQLEYSLPRLKRMWTHLSRIKAGIGMRGPGEKQIEEDRRLVEHRIRDLKADLKNIEKRKERLVASRVDRLAVSLVGYTNAGKSTLMNSLTGAGVYAANKLFATLDTRTRRWMLPSWGPVLLSDTVGFIRDLPHSLIASFKATLEEARQADLLLHVADASNPAVLDQISAVYEVLRELGIEEKDTLLVLNKVDRVAERSDLAPVLQRYPNAIPLSARTREGFEKLHAAASEALSRSFADLHIETSVANGRLLAFLAAHGEVLERRYDENDRVHLRVRMPQRHLGALYEEGTTFGPYVAAPGDSAGLANTMADELSSEQRSIGEVAQSMARRSISGLRVLVTGASSGIGAALVDELLSKRARVVALARRADRLAATAARLAPHDQFRWHAGDVTSPADRAAALELAVREFGGLDALINNAGIGAHGPFATADDARLRHVMEVNLFAPAELIRQALPLLRQGNRPIIVNIGSVLGHCAVPGKSEYCASKFALHGLSDALRAEFAKEGIDLLLVSPSTTTTEFFDVAAAQSFAFSPARNPFGTRSAGMVAKDTVAAMAAGRREIILSAGGKLLVWFDRLCPSLVSWFVARWT